MFENLDLGTIITVVLGLIATFAGVFWSKAKTKIGQIVTAGKELSDVGTKLTKALADDKITKDEVEELKAEWAEAKAALKAIIGK